MGPDFRPSDLSQPASRRAFLELSGESLSGKSITSPLRGPAEIYTEPIGLGG